MKFLAVKRLGGLQPIDEAGEAAMCNVGLGEVVTASGIVVHHYERIGKWLCESHGRVTEAPCWHRRLIEKEEERHGK